VVSSAWLQRLRLWTGLVLFFFLATHLLNHGLGNISLEAMEWGRRLFLGLWRSPPGTILLYGAIALHALVVVQSLLRRRRLTMPPGEAVQIGFGLAIPLLLATHVVATRGGHEVHGLEDSYAFVLLSLWLWDWQQGLMQTVALLIAWTHGCLGLHYWLRLKPGYGPWRGLLLALAVLLPAVGLAGFAAGAREAALLAQDQLWLERQLALIGLPNEAAVDWIHAWAFTVRVTAAVVVLGVVAFRAGRWLHERRHTITLTYPNGRQVNVDRGHTVLEASQAGGIPHASVCGGRGRCSTCRIRVVGDDAGLPPPSDQEVKVLKRVGAAEGVRLACQLRPRRDLAVAPLLPAAAEPKHGYRKARYLQGAEREIAILFSDIRAFTQFAESKLPYDVVFVINAYYRAMGTAVEAAGGHLDKFIGDGVMALFGVETGLQRGAAQALEAARGMTRALDEINDGLLKASGERLRMGIGIHTGACVVGEMGYRDISSVTAIGDAVNTASRLEVATKEFACQLVVSEDVATAAGIDLSGFQRQSIQVRGRAEPLVVYVVDDVSRLPPAKPATN
jgi:adenylate cyclase